MNDGVFFRESAVNKDLLAVDNGIDGHSHLFLEEGYAEKLIEAARQQGIARISVSGQGERVRMPDNAGVLEQAERHPDRLIPFAFFQLGEDKPERVMEFKKQGFRGIKFCSPFIAYDDEQALPVYEKIEEAGLPAQFHTGVLATLPGELCGVELIRPARLDSVARRFPGMRILLCHLGVPEYEMAATLARIVRNIYVDLTGCPGRGWYVPKKPEFFRELFYWPAWHRKVVFGTDVRYEEVPAAADEYARMFGGFDLDEEARNDLYRDTYREFLGEIPARDVGYHSFIMKPDES